MADSTKIGKLLQQFTQAIGAHDRENPDHHTWGIGMAGFDLERLGLEDGEEILPGIVLQADGGVSGQFRILCDGDHGSGIEEREEETVEAVGSEEVGAPQYVPVGPGGPDREPGELPPPVRPPF
jgi:hypothetical protein